MTVSLLKLDNVSARAVNEPKMREFLALANASEFEKQIAEIRAYEERPFVSDSVWALFSAYLAIIVSGYALLKMMEIGVENAPKMMNTEHVAALIKTVLPHQSEKVDRLGIGGGFYFLDEIETKLLAELKAMLDGAQHDSMTVNQSADILKHVAKVSGDFTNVPI